MTESETSTTVLTVKLQPHPRAMNKDYYSDPTNWYWLLLLTSAGLYLLFSEFLGR